MSLEKGLVDPSKDDPDIVLRSVVPGTPGARTVSYVEFIDTPMASLTVEMVQAYAEARALIEGGFPLVPSSTSTDDASSPLGKKNRASAPPTASPRPLPRDSTHQREEFASQPHWKQLLSVMSSTQYNTETGQPEAATSTLPLLSREPRNLSADVARNHRRANRRTLLANAAKRMGLEDVPLVSQMHLQYHGFLVDRSLFEHDDDGMPIELQQATTSLILPNVSTMNITAMRGAAQAKEKEESFIEGLLTPTSKAKHHALKHLRDVAAKERRLGSANRWAAFDPNEIKRPDVPNAVIFEWSRFKPKHVKVGKKGISPTKRAGTESPKASSPKATLQEESKTKNINANTSNSSSAIHLPSEEFWISLKGIVFRIDIQDVTPGRRLYYRMVLVPLYSGRDCTEEFARMVRKDNKSKQQQSNNDEANHDTILSSGDERREEGSSSSTDEEEEDWDLNSSLRGMRRRYPDRSNVALSRKERANVDRIFALFVHDFSVVGVLADRAWNYWW